MNTYEFDCNELDHCKLRWTFTIEEVNDDQIINDLTITEREKPIGCAGHPQTIIALVKGGKISSINTKLLKEAVCKKEISCGGFLAECISNIKSSYA